jgi:hypothetical protein
MATYDHELRGTIALVLGVLSILGGGLFGVGAPFLGIPAWVLANQVRREVSPLDPQYGLARAGKVCGILGLFIAFGWLLLLVPAILAYLGVAAGLATH